MLLSTVLRPVYVMVGAMALSLCIGAIIVSLKSYFYKLTPQFRMKRGHRSLFMRSSIHDKIRGHLQWHRMRGQMRGRRDSIYYLPCIAGTRWSHFHPTSNRCSTPDLQCIVCHKQSCQNMDVTDDNAICYSCDADDGCWCCSAHCYNKLILSYTAGQKTFHVDCYPFYIGYVRDRMHGYNACKLNIYQANYELMLQFLIHGFMAQSCSKRKITTSDNCLALIAAYYTPKITAFQHAHRGSVHNLYLFISDDHRKVLHLKPELPDCNYKDYSHPNCCAYTAACSPMVMEKGKIYYAVLKIIECETNGLYMGIIPEKHGLLFQFDTDVTGIGNCFLYGNAGSCHHNQRTKIPKQCAERRMKQRFAAQDVIKCVIDLCFGVLAFIHLNKPGQEPVAFRINRDIRYRFIVASCHSADEYQLME